MKFFGEGYFFADKGLVLILCLLLLPLATLAQGVEEVSQDSINQDDQRQVLIDNIFITGNKKTKDKIILREISIKIGGTYTIEALNVLFETDHDKIYNTKLKSIL